MRGQMLWLKLALGAIFILGIFLWLAPYFQGAQTPNPVWLNLGSWELRWYGLLMALAVLIGIWVVNHLNQQFTKINPDPLFYILIATVFGGFIGARLMFVILDWTSYAGNPSEILQIHNGGMSIHGAILGGAIGLWLISRRYHLNGWQVADLAVVALPIGQAIGRFGNFFNQEAFGGPTNLPWKMFISPEFRPEGFATASFFHPTFLYEAIGDLIIGIILWTNFAKLSRRSSQTTLWYLLLYSGWRFVMEWFRIDSQSLGALTIAQWASLGIVVVTATLLFKQRTHGN